MKLRKVITTAGFIMASITPANAELYMCQSCPVGSWSDGTFTSCKNCLTTGAESCNPETGEVTGCQESYGFNSNNATCSLCPAGTFSDGGTNSCTSCPAGTYSNRGASSCTICPANTYSASAGSTSCTTCPTNTSSSEGSSKCENIEWILDKQWLNGYIILPAGRYKFETSGAGGGGGGSTATLWKSGYGAKGGNGFVNSIIVDFNTTKKVWCYGGLKGLAGAGGSLCVPAFPGADGADSWIKVTSTSCGDIAELCDGTNYAYAKGGAGGKGGVCGKTQSAASSGTGVSGGARGGISAGIGKIGSDGTNGWCRIYKMKVTSTSTSTTTTTNPPTKR